MTWWWPDGAGDVEVLKVVERVQSTSDGRHRHCAITTTSSQLLSGGNVQRRSPELDTLGTSDRHGAQLVPLSASCD